MNTKGGFTIVELLIVVVVIAILAAITIVSYNGITARANNTATISAAKQLVTLVEGYRAVYGSYPFTHEMTYSLCGTTDNRCTSNILAVNTRDNTPLMDELKKIGTPPSSGGNPAITGQYGVQYIYLPDPDATFNGGPAPVRIEYFLTGTNVNCGLQNIAASPTNINPTTSSTTGYTVSMDGATHCSVRL